MRPERFERHLTGIGFPIQKRDLVARMENTGAPDEVVREVRRLPVERFDSLDDVRQALERA